MCCIDRLRPPSIADVPIVRDTQSTGLSLPLKNLNAMDMARRGGNEKEKALGVAGGVNFFFVLPVRLNSN